MALATGMLIMNIPHAAIETEEEHDDLNLHAQPKLPKGIPASYRQKLGDLANTLDLCGPKCRAWS